MKNIHVLQTDNSSKIFYSGNNSKLLFSNKPISFKTFEKSPQNIYITSDEEIKEGDWCYQVELNDGKIDKCYDVTLYHTWTNNGVDKTRKFKKIILTTDQDLIKDGVQAIDDEFLEWFVKNSSCESVEVVDDTLTVGEMSKLPLGTRNHKYKIIISKEEPKEYPIGGYAPGFYSGKCVTCKKEFIGDKRAVQCKPCAISTTKEQDKKLYSYEDLLSAFEQGMMFIGEDKGSFKEWFEQFKKQNNNNEQSR